MAPSKKKEKGKLLEWLQCSLCKKLISQQDSDVHSTSCSADNGYIQDKILHGKVINAENFLGDDGVAITKSIRDRDSVVWLAVQTMQVCGLSIGQPCVVNNVVVKRSWPHKSLPLSSVALSAGSREELGLTKEDALTLQRCVPEAGVLVESAVLRLREENPMFETEEFSAFTTGYLDGKLITEGSPLLIRYFGQTCHCTVESIVCKWAHSTTSEHKLKPFVAPGYGALPGTPSTLESPTASPQTPGKNASANPALQTPGKNASANRNSSLCTTPVPNLYSSRPAADHDGRGGDIGRSPIASTPDAVSKNLADSIASLNISDATSPACQTPVSCLPPRSNYPNLVTPVKGEGQGGEGASLSSPAVFAKVSLRDTVLSVKGASTEENEDAGSGTRSQRISLDDVGGLDDQIRELKMRTLRALQARSTSRCLLVHGPGGTGKSLLVKALTSDLGLPTTTLAGTDIWSRLFGEAESNLRKIFKTAQERAPSIVVIDDIDVVCPKRSQQSTGQQQHRIVGTLLSLIDEVCSKKNARGAVVVLGVTNNRDGLDPALRRAGRFGSEIEVGVPTAPQRTQILQTLLRQVAHTLSEEDIGTLAANAHGYVGADLAALINEASMHAVTVRTDESVSTGDGHHPIPPVTLEDMVYAGLHTKPSALREIQLEVPQVRWSDIGGMSEVKMRLREAVELPLSHPEVFTNLGIEPPRGLLMYGPPGCSKTMVARALATECKLNFLAVKGPELFNQYVGESEKAIREVFRKARSAAPSVVFFDEIDAIAAKRGSSSGGSGVDDRVLTQLLTEMDGLEFLKDVFIMAATNRPDKIDNALLRPGRFDSLVYVPLPDADTRQEILQHKFTKMAVTEGICLAGVVEATQGYSGAEVVQVCHEAAMYALRENLGAAHVDQRHFDAALQKVRPQVNPELLRVYDKFSQASIK